MEPISFLSALSSAGLGPAAGTGGAAGAAGGAAQAGGDAAGSSGTGAGSFGKMLADKIGALNDSLQQAGSGAQDLAAGRAQDISSVVTQIEKANLELQLATQIRNKAVESYQDLFRMQI
jgi:flagellar hook-basal body complex protein FliE